MLVDDASRKTRLAALADLYEEIRNWVHANYDSVIVRRKVEAVHLNARLLIVGEAHARDQVRLTGINWFDKQGRLGKAGKNLDVILRCLRYTVHPPTSIDLSCGSVQPKESGLTTVYTTDILPCYPPGGTLTPMMLTEALKQWFLVREVEILRPKVVLLLGRHSYKTFYTHLVQSDTGGTISKEFTFLAPSTELAEYEGARVVPFLHPSPQSGTFSHWFRQSRPTLCEQPQVRAIASTLTLQE